MDDEGDEIGEGPDIEDLDDDMRGLLQQLDEPDHVGTMGDVSPPPALTPVTPEERRESEPPPAETMVPQDIRKLDLTPPPVIQGSDMLPPEPPIVDLRKQFEQMDAVASEVIQAARSDRQETQDVITICRTEIDKAINANHIPNRGYLDNIVKALEVKASINLTVIKAMDAKAKLLAATKAGVNVGVNVQNSATSISQTGSTDPTLVALLSENPLSGSGEDEF